MVTKDGAEVLDEPEYDVFPLISLSLGARSGEAAKRSRCGVWATGTATQPYRLFEPHQPTLSSVPSHLEHPSIPENHKNGGG